MFVQSEKILRGIYIFCAAQFAFFFIYLNFIAGPLTKDTMSTLLFSVVFGIIFSGVARRDFQTFTERKQKLDQLTDLDQTLKRIRDDQRK